MSNIRIYSKEIIIINSYRENHCLTFFFHYDCMYFLFLMMIKELCMKNRSQLSRKVDFMQKYVQKACDINL